MDSLQQNSGLLGYKVEIMSVATFYLLALKNKQKTKNKTKQTNKQKNSHSLLQSQSLGVFTPVIPALGRIEAERLLLV